MTENFFSPCPRGLEAILANELATLGAQEVRATDGGVHFSGPFLLSYHVNLHSRIASRVLWRVAMADYRSEQDIYGTVYALPWADWFDTTRTIRVNMAAIKCPLKSLDFATLKIKDAVCDKFRVLTGERPSVDTHTPDIRIHAFLEQSRMTLYVDTSGDALFKRGVRQYTNVAPLRENLAAGILHLAGWQPGTPLLDPMCGSGTFLIEAALMSLNIAPGINRGFAFEKIITAIREGRRPDGTIIGPPMPIGLYRGMSDNDVGAIVAYLRAAKPVRNKVPKSEYKVPLPPSYGPPVGKVAEVPRTDKVAYGRYLAGPAGHCIGCHSPPGPQGAPDIDNKLGAGGFSFFGPWGTSVSTNITPSNLSKYSVAELKKVITTGVRPDGSRLKPPMAIPYYAKIPPADLDALVAYLRSLPPK